MGTVEPLVKDLYSIIWNDPYPKKIKFFLWEPSFGVVNIVDRLQRRMSYMSLSPSWCIMCRCHLESPAHLFVHCSFASHFWHIILEAFGWSVTYHDPILDIVASLLVGRPFRMTKKMVWLANMRAFQNSLG